MMLEYSLDQNDYLQYQLYFASKSERIKYKRKKSFFIVIIMFLSFAGLFYMTGQMLLMYYFAGCTLLSIPLYPLYSKTQYKKHYRKFIADTYKNRFGEVSRIIFGETLIETFDRTGESKIKVSEIEEIFEVKDYFYLKTLIGTVLIIPKYKIENSSNIKNILKLMAHKLSINYTTELDWKWK